MTIHWTITQLLKTAGAVAFLFTAFTIPAIAQSNKGEIKGTVKDQSGAIVQNAQVTVTNTGTGATRSVNTGDDGTYYVPLLGSEEHTSKPPKITTGRCHRADGSNCAA